MNPENTGNTVGRALRDIAHGPSAETARIIVDAWRNRRASGHNGEDPMRSAMRFLSGTHESGTVRAVSTIGVGIGTDVILTLINQPALGNTVVIISAVIAGSIHIIDAHRISQQHLVEMLAQAIPVKGNTTTRYLAGRAIERCLDELRHIGSGIITVAGMDDITSAFELLPPQARRTLDAVDVIDLRLWTSTRLETYLRLMSEAHARGVELRRVRVIDDRCMDDIEYRNTVVHYIWLQNQAHVDLALCYRSHAAQLGLSDHEGWMIVDAEGDRENVGGTHTFMQDGILERGYLYTWRCPAVDALVAHNQTLRAEITAKGWDRQVRRDLALGMQSDQSAV